MKFPAFLSVLAASVFLSITVVPAQTRWNIADDGSIVYTNGSAVYHLGADGKPVELCVGKMIEHVAVVG